MPAVLFSKTGLFAGTSFNISGDATIGKGDGNNIVLRSEIVSSNHARITYDDAQQAYFLEDLGSSNGTLLDGTRIKGKERLERLHVITFAGKFDFIFQVGGVAPPKSSPKVPTAIQEQKTMVEKGSESPSALPSFGKKAEKPEEKTMFDSGKEKPSGLPQFGKQPTAPKPPAPQDMDKTSFESGQSAAAGLPSFGKKPDASKPEPPKPEPPKDMSKTSFDSGQDVPAGLPKFGGPKPVEEEKTIAASSSPDATIPATPQKPSAPPPAPPQSEVERTEVMKQPPSPPPSAKPRFMLTVGKTNKEFELKDGQTSIGRTIGCDIIIDDVSMSRKHAMITVTGDKVLLKDLGSSNGTSVDKKRISSEVEISPSSDIRLGMVGVKIKKVV